MAVSKVQICNLALAHLHQTESTIANLDTDTGNTADQCRIHYDVARQFVLADHTWSFAKRRVTLSDIGSPPATWLYRYDYPAECLRFREIQKQTRQEIPIPFEIEDDGTGSGLCVLTDEKQAIGIYTADVENVVLFSPGFVAALGWYLASELAPALTGDLNVQQTCIEIYRGHIMAAQAVDSEQGEQSPELESPWERARQGSA